MSSNTRRLLQRLANVGLAMAVLLACVPYGMRAYGQWSESRALQRVSSRLPSNASPSAAQALRKPKKAPPRRDFQTMLVDIPARGVETVVEEGHGNWQMMVGGGHEPGTPGAGGAGNCVVAAHRNMWGAPFADLPSVRPGDTIRVTDERGTYTYQVAVSKEIHVRDRRYLANTRDARLTLYTCVEPFDKDLRWVVQAHLVVPD